MSEYEITPDKGDLVSRSYLCKEYIKHDFFPAIIRNILWKAPAVDAVVVIRCKNCGWYRPEDESCGFWPDEGYRDPEHYCGEGKPREND